jgi:hypothetical protein
MYYYGYFRINSFADAEARYNSVKPIRGSDNIRPIGDRRRKWEHIHKFSRNCYGLFDGGVGDPKAQWWNCSDLNVTDAEAKSMAPVLWWRDKYGSDHVRFRNETGSGGHTSRYKFLSMAMPAGISFEIRNGKQFIVYGGDKYFLAKGTRVPSTWLNANATAWLRRSDSVTTVDDGVAITFVRFAEYTRGWKFDGGGKDMPQPPRTLVDTKTKAKYKEDIQQFWDWLCVVTPMLPVKDWDYLRDKKSELREYTQSVVGLDNLEIGRTTLPEVALQIIMDYNSPLRVNMALEFLKRSYITSVQTEEDIKKVRSQYNRWINKTLGFNKTC